MKGRGLLVAAIVLAALSGTLYWSNHRKPASTTVTSAAEASPKVLEIKPADVVGIKIAKRDGAELALSKNANGKWQITSPKSMAADQDAVSSLLSALSPLNSDRLLEEKTTDLNAYGLS